MNSNLEIVVWDVQHGNAIYMKTPNGKHFMFDIGTGSYEQGKEFSPLKQLKYKYRVNRLDYLVISHPHADHISDINNLFDLSLKPEVLHRPKNIDPDIIKGSNQSQYSDLVNRYLELDRSYTASIAGGWLDPSNPSNYGEVQIDFFSQRESGTQNLNNYSIVTVVKYSCEKIIIPGDIEEAGWKVLLERQDFQQAIIGTTVFVASHHGREAGYHSDIFNYFKPNLVIVSDGPSTDTSVTGRYKNHAQGRVVKSRTAGHNTGYAKRYVLTTRKDGVIHIRVHNSGMETTIN